MTDSRVASTIQASARAGVTGVLCALMAAQPVLSETPAAKSAQIVRVQQVQGEARVLHALNRFTFGPRPGDMAAVGAMGLDRWFEQQLNPESIPDRALDDMLTRFPAMRLTQVQLMDRFPDPQMVRQMAQNKRPLPSDPTIRVLYRDLVANYDEQQKKQAEAKAADATMAGGMSDSMQAANTSKRPEMPKVNMLGPDSTNAGNLKKPAKAAENVLNGAGPGARVAGGPAHKEDLYPEAKTTEILGLDPTSRIHRILAMKPEEMRDFRQSLSGPELALLTSDLSPEEKEVLEALQGPSRMVGGEILQSRLDRDIYSERQLEAVMTDFWLNHFNVFIRKNQNEPYLIPEYERNAIRPNALGKFEDLLVATATSPAMLVYLDNMQSVGPHSLAAMRGSMVKKMAPNSQMAKVMSLGLNENYGRELMELHTLGVRCEVSAEHPVGQLEPSCGRGYTQADVTEVAKVFTGWGINRPGMAEEFAFQPQRHEPGAKHVLGQVIQQSGETEGLQVLHMLATSPATAKFISTKLAVRFVSDTPPEALVDRMAQAFLASGGDIKTVLRTMFKSPEFWSTEAVNAKMKTPLEFVVSAVRASGATVENAQPLVQTLDKLGMPLYGMQTPNGYSWMAEPWTGTGDLVDRMNFALALSGNKLPGVRVDWTSALGNAGDAMAKEQRLETALLGHTASERTRSTVLAQYADVAAQTPGAGQRPRMVAMGMPAAQDQQAMGMAGLLLGSPEFQRR